MLKETSVGHQMDPTAGKKMLSLMVLFKQFMALFLHVISVHIDVSLNMLQSNLKYIKREPFLIVNKNIF